MSNRLSTRYVEVERSAASRSIALPCLTKCVTSAMCTPHSKVAIGKVSGVGVMISLQPGGSIEHTVMYVDLFVSAREQLVRVTVHPCLKARHT